MTRFVNVTLKFPVDADGKLMVGENGELKGQLVSSTHHYWAPVVDRYLPFFVYIIVYIMIALWLIH